MDLIFRQQAIEIVRDMVKRNPIACARAVTEIQQLPNVKVVPTWIPCSERPPEKDGTYLCTVEWILDDKRYSVQELAYGTPLLPMNSGDGRGWYLVTDEGDYYYDGVLAWMELPEPWEGERDESQIIF